MSLPFELVRGLMALEMIIFVFLILPIPFQLRKKALQYIMRNPLPEWVKRSLQIVFVLVVVLFADSLNRSIKMSHDRDEPKIRSHDHTYSDHYAKMFYAQRNMYLTGFTLFLSLILNSFLTSLMDIMVTEEKMAVIQKQVGGQSKEYLRLVEETETQSQTIAELKKQLAESVSQVKKSDVVVKQAKSQHDEYMRLCDRYNELEKKLEHREKESKKDL